MADTVSDIYVGASGPDYADPQLWEDDTNVSVGRWIGEFQDDSEYLNDNLTFSGGTGTPDADNFSWLRIGSSGTKHSGVTGSGHVRIRDTAGHVITLERNFTVIEGVEVVQDGTGASDECFRVGAAGSTLLSRCIIRATSNTSQQDGVYTQTNSVDVYIDNCVIYDFARAGLHLNSGSGGDWYVDSCSVYNCGRTNSGADVGGISSGEASTTYNVFNSWAMDSVNGGDFNEQSADPTWNGTNNIASDTSAEGEPANFTASYDSVVLIDTDPGSGENVHVNDISGRDFGIADEDTETVTQNGVDRSATHPAPQTYDGVNKVQDLSTDIADVSRTATWSIGAFEFVAAGGPQITSVSGDNIWPDGATEIPIVGTGFV